MISIMPPPPRRLTYYVGILHLCRRLLPPLQQITQSSLSKISVSSSDVLRILLKLNTSKAIGADKISNRVLKEIAHQISPSLTAIINMSLTQSKFPSKWKEATITPIYKGKKVSNPITDLCLFCQMLPK